jgi:hypothetical protein
MRPTPAETISGIRRILKEVIEPEVGSEYARARLHEIRAVLAQIDWDDAALHLLRRYGTLVELTTEVRQWIAAEPERAVVFADLAARLPGGPAPRGTTFAELAEAHRQVAAVLAESVTRISHWSRSRSDDRSGSELCDLLVLRLAG